MAANGARRRLMVAALVCFALAFVVFLVFLYLRQPTLAKVKDLVGLCSLAVAVVGVGLTVRAQRAPPADPMAAMPSAERELADVIRAQWRQEASRRGLLTNPLHVRWASTPRAVQADPATIVPVDDVRVTGLRWSGEVTEAATRFRKLPSRRLVILGGPGSGKSSMAALLVCGLSADRPTEEPVPVLLSLAGWNPRAEHLDDWMARRLEDEYRLLRDRRRFGPGMAARLIAAGRVLPVLDGLDEMADDLRTTALGVLAAVVEVERPFVLTCRTEEFVALIERTDTPLARAAVVELQPVAPDGVAAYLPGSQVSGLRRWRPVLAEIEAQPAGVLARALSSPLMIALARRVYESPATDPAELFALSTPDEIEAHLLDSYLPSVYGGGPPARAGESRDPGYAVDDVLRWFHFLATHLAVRHEIDIAWWRLNRSMGAWVERLLVLVVGVVALWPVAALVTLQDGHLETIDLVPALLPLMLVAATAQHSTPMAFDLNLRSGIPATLLLTIAGIVITQLLGIDLIVVSLLFVAGVMLGLSAGIMRSTRVAKPASPLTALRGDRAGILTVVAAGLGAFMLGKLVADLVVPGAWSLSMPLNIAMMSGCSMALLPILPGAAWFRFCLARVWMAGRRQMPLRCLTFLEDAHRRGVLRQVGAVYQFRHLRLQEHLAQGPGTRRPQARKTVVGAA